MDTISIIVPVYNCESTLVNCLDSIVSQTYPNIEVILVDDGSDDLSSSICLDYVAKHEYIHYYSKEHSGVASTRAFGINKATGNYIGFVDSDDTIDEKMYQLMHQKMQFEHSQICICGYETVLNNTSTPYISDFIVSPITPVFCMQSMCNSPYIEGFLCNKLYRSELLHNFSLDTSLPVCEDFNTNIRLLSSLPNVPSISYLPLPLYHYIKKEHSLTCSLKLFFDDIFIYEPAFQHIWCELGIDYFWSNKIPIFSKYYSILFFSLISLLNAPNPDKKMVFDMCKIIKSFYKSYNKLCGFTLRQKEQYIFMTYLPFLYRRIRL